MNEFLSRQYEVFVIYGTCDVLCHISISYYVIRYCCLRFCSSALLDWIYITCYFYCAVLYMPCMLPGQAASCDMIEHNTRLTITYHPILFYHISFFSFQFHFILFYCVSLLQLYCRCDDFLFIEITLFHNKCKLNIKVKCDNTCNRKWNTENNCYSSKNKINV